MESDSDKPNILLVILDTVRAKNTSLHGHYNRTTPALEQFAAQATVYRQARAPSIHSVASHASIWTGLHVPEHNVTEHEGRLSPEATIWTRLQREYEYQTGLFTPNYVIANASNLFEPFETVETPDFGNIENARLFDAFDPTDVKELEGVSGNLKRAITSGKPVRALANTFWRGYREFNPKWHDYQKADGAEFADRFLEWEAERDGPWAACVNVLDAHYPYIPTAEYDNWSGEKIRDLHESLAGRTLSDQYYGSNGRPWGELKALESLYDGGIRQADAVVKQLVTALRERGELDETLLVITSDHGEGFGERSFVAPDCRAVTHSWGVHEEITHVPLVVKWPEQHASRTETAPASLTNIPAAMERAIDRPTGIPDPSDDPLLDGPVLTMTERLRKEDRPDRPEPYFGPWKAVYEPIGDDGAVRKHVVRGETDPDVATVDCFSAQAAVESHSSDSRTIVTEAFDSLSPKPVADGTNEVDDDVENRLADLGYLR
ncbi:sulfatase-like hydrolase/transferase [Natrialba sp. PRR66]|uniref:sulfatase-like hydrolase/transferase n=1 Tax=Natrialba sp. PRR66 TaxID=3098146 RepID=UPI002B1D5E78|nr:sulfatase-like hydrolase/transferase [Natrialba sp. PRR66]